MAQVSVSNIGQTKAPSPNSPRDAGVSRLSVGFRHLMDWSQNAQHKHSASSINYKLNIYVLLYTNSKLTNVMEDPPPSPK